MTRHSYPVVALLLTLTLTAPAASSAQDLSPIPLPAPAMDGGKPLLTTLKTRSSSREFAPDAIPPQTLSTLLWAAWGLNRPDGRRTAPSASNRQEIDIYVTLPAGAYLWDAKSNTLLPVAPGDHRALTGAQPFPATAPLNLVYVADMAKVSRPAADPQQMLNIDANTGSSRRTSTCSAPRKDWPRWCAPSGRRPPAPATARWCSTTARSRASSAASAPRPRCATPRGRP